MVNHTSDDKESCQIRGVQAEAFVQGTRLERKISYKRKERKLKLTRI